MNDMQLKRPENVFAVNSLTARATRALMRIHRRSFILFWAPFAIAAFFALSALYLDGPISRSLTAWPEPVRAFFAFITDFGKSDWILIPALIGMLLGLAAQRARLTFSWKWAVQGLTGVSAFVFIGVGLPGLVAAILKRTIGRARPSHLDELGTLHFGPFDWVDWTMQSFPSGHSTTALAFTVVLVTLTNGKFRAAIITFGLLIGLSRIVTSMHYFTDVVGGVAWGSVGALVVRDWFASRNIGMRIEGGRVRYRMFTGFEPLWRKLRRGQLPRVLK